MQCFHCWLVFENWVCMVCSLLPLKYECFFCYKCQVKTNQGSLGLSFLHLNRYNFTCISVILSAMNSPSPPRVCAASWRACTSPPGTTRRSGAWRCPTARRCSVLPWATAGWPRRRTSVMCASCRWAACRRSCSPSRGRWCAWLDTPASSSWPTTEPWVGAGTI